MSAAAPANAGRTPAGKAAPKSSAVKNLAGLRPYLRRYPGGITIGLITLVLMGVVGNVIPLATGIVTDTLAGSPRPFAHAIAETGAPTIGAGWLTRVIPWYQPHSRQTLLIYCLILILCVAIKGVLSFSTRWILIGVSRDIDFDIRNDLLKRLLVMEPEFYVRNRTGELMSRATNDLNNVRMVLGPGIMYSGTTLATMVLALSVMFKLSPALTLWVMLPVPVVFVVVRHFGKIIHELYEKIQASLATLSAKVQENLSGVRVVRAYAQEEAEIRAFDEPNREYVATNVKLIRNWSMFMPSLQALIGTTFLIVLWQGGHLLLRREISLGALIAFYTYLGQLVWPMIALGWVTNIFQRGAASMGRLTYILGVQPEIDDRYAKVPAGTVPHGEIEFRNLTFRFPTTASGNGAAPSTKVIAGNGSAPTNNGNAHSATRDGSGQGPTVLHDINLRIPAGSTLAIVGPTGSGKSTLAALIARLWEAPDGTILVDGRPIREGPLEALRGAIGYVPQDTYLFSET